MITKEYEAVRDCHRTMGYAEVPIRHPNEFLMKHDGVKKPCNPKDRPCSYRRPPIPSRNEEVEIRHEDKNFMLINIDRAVSAKPKKIKPKFADTRNGDFHDLKKSGLFPIYIHQEKFGNVPRYLVKRKADLNRQLKVFKKGDEEKEPLCRYVTKEERNKMLNGLKQNWEKLQQTYLRLPVLTDTIPKVARKTRMENELKQLEKDILLMERHTNIYVYRDTENNKKR